MKNPHAQALGSLGGKASAKALTADQRKERAKKASDAAALKRAHTISPIPTPPHTAN